MDSPEAGARPSWVTRLVFGAALLALVFLFRLPPLLNAEALSNSDAAIVGLQARHVWDGELSPLLWGTRYQGTLEVIIAAVVGAPFSHRPALGLALTPLLAHAVLVLCLFAMLSRRLHPWVAALAAGSLVLCPTTLNFSTLNPPRQWSFALVFAGLYLAERAMDAGTRRSLAAFALSAGLAIGVGYYSDLFVLMLLPGIVAYFASSLVAVRAGDRVLAAAASLAGYVLASIPRWALGMRRGTFGEISFRNISRNWSLFVDCLRLLFGLDANAPLAWFGAACFAALAMAAAVQAFLRTTRPDERRLILCGWGWMAAAPAAFLLSRQAEDIASTRYLAPILLGFPLALAGPFGVMRAWPRLGRAVPAAAAVIAVAFGAGTWFRYGDSLDHGFPVAGPQAGAKPEMALLAELKRRGVEAGFAPYWSAYRLTFLWSEQVVLTSPDTERYPPYRARVRAARTTAIVVPDVVPGQPIVPWEAQLSQEGRKFERVDVAGYGALVVDGPLNPTNLAHRLSVQDAPRQLAAGATTQLRLSVRNTGLLPWDPAEVFCSYHVRDEANRMVIPDGIRTPLPSVIRPGDSVEVPLAVRAPDSPGTYVVEVDLVQERVTWFAERDNPLLKLPLTVTSGRGPAPSSAR